ncbi:hypothetical protein WOLCODRAFT_162446 [Wolfiporia cocos MD-104 SS10]|uniref:Uncharacterized protein n=1 Tax=Wolfiporia cocos (strain MD-104) TaxID=742152 RepID=A0A2H3JFD5_WOLCO|nr:hypothetical protein WOLCODRAFT_162446 [Wolfiporia cocos MD-104 SS10]
MSDLRRDTGFATAPNHSELSAHRLGPYAKRRIARSAAAAAPRRSSIDRQRATYLHPHPPSAVCHDQRAALRCCPVRDVSSVAVTPPASASVSPRLQHCASRPRSACSGAARTSPALLVDRGRHFRPEGWPCRPPRRRPQRQTGGRLRFPARVYVLSTRVAVLRVMPLRLRALVLHSRSRSARGPDETSTAQILRANGRVTLARKSHARTCAPGSVLLRTVWRLRGARPQVAIGCRGRIEEPGPSPWDVLVWSLAVLRVRVAGTSDLCHMSYQLVIGVGILTSMSSGYPEEGRALRGVLVLAQTSPRSSGRVPFH